MVEYEVPLPPGTGDERVVAAVEAGFAARQLDLVSRGTLAKYPGSVHWHFRRGKERGTVEVTFWPARGRLWIRIQAGRVGAWQAEVVPGLLAAVAESLRGCVGCPREARGLSERGPG